MTRLKKSTVVHSLAKYSLVALLLLGVWLFSLTRPVGPGIAQEFVISKGESAAVIASRLKAAGLIRSPLMFRLIVKQAGLSGSLQAGYFVLAPSLTAREVAFALTKGMAKFTKLTVPEGYRLEQIAEAAGIPVSEFLSQAQGLEGQLFPDTYFLAEDYSVTDVIDLMHKNYQTKAGGPTKDTLILASLIERETKSAAEKPVVAGILKKRLSAGWPLELDATIQYFLGKPGAWWPNTTLLDRRLKSPYNTYLNQGLPPGPICNPGLDSLNAANSPQDSPYWFYLHDRTGQIHYGATLEEHNQNIARFIN